MSDDDIRLGMIGLDTSHVAAFTRILHDAEAPGHVPGARVSVAWPGGSPDWALSRSRVEGFTATLRDEFGVRIVDSPEAVAEGCDVLLIESVDGRVHREMLERTLPAGRPTFLDKPLALTVADAEGMLQAADRAGVPLMSCSALRFASTFQNALADDAGGPIVGIDVHGPLTFESTQPGYFWYGIHSVEMIVAALGVGCRSVRAIPGDDHEILIAEWHDGRLATFHGLRDAHTRFGGSLHRKQKAQHFDASASDPPFYARLLRAILSHLPQGRTAVATGEMLEVVRLIESANAARASGHPVDLPA